MKNLKKILVATSLVAMTLPSVISAAGKLPSNASSIPVSIKVEGTYRNPSNDLGIPYVDTSTNRTMVPIRFVSNELGLNIKYLQKSKESPQGGILISSKDTSITLNTNSKNATVVKGTDKKVVSLDAASIIYDGRTYVPVRFISEALGYKVDWANNTVSISKKQLVGNRYNIKGYELYWEKEDNDTMALKDPNGVLIIRDSVSFWEKAWIITKQPDIGSVGTVEFKGTDFEMIKCYDLDRVYFNKNSGNNKHWSDNSSYNPKKDEKPSNNNTYTPNKPNITKPIENTDLVKYGSSSHFTQILNEYRSRNGLAPMVEDSELNRVAALRAEEELDQLIATEDFDHESPAGLIDMYGENLCSSYTNSGSESRTEEHFLNRWIESPEHNANLLYPTGKRVGYAVAKKTVNGTTYHMASMVFATN